jgi:hypothetical protein
MALKIALFSPIPSASDSTATAVNPGLYGQRPDAVPHVLPDALHEPHVDLPDLLADAGEVAEVLLSLAAGGFRRQALPEVALGALLEVEVQLVVDFAMVHAHPSLRSAAIGSRAAARRAGR